MMRWLRSFWRGSGSIRILAVMPRTPDSHTLSQIAAKERWRVEFAKNPAAALRLMERERFPVILCDRDVDGASDWRASLDSLASAAPRACLILTAPSNNDTLWQEVISHGGFDVLTKPFQEQRVIRAIYSALEARGRS